MYRYVDVFCVHPKVVGCALVILFGAKVIAIYSSLLLLGLRLMIVLKLTLKIKYF